MSVLEAEPGLMAKLGKYKSGKGCLYLNSLDDKDLSVLRTLVERSVKPVRYIRSTFVPGESHCMCLFEAPDAGLVKAVNDEANTPYTRISEALDLTP